MPYRLQSLYHGPWFSISEFRCSGGPPCLGPDEASPVHEISLVRSGGFVRQVGGHRTLADPNQVLFFNPDEAYRVAHPPGLCDECFVVAPSEPALRELVAHHDPEAAARPQAFRKPSAPCSTAAFVLQQRLAFAVRQPTIDHLAVEEAMLALLDECLRPLAARAVATRPRRAPTRSRHRELAEAVKELLATRLAQPLRLHQIGREVGAAPFHLARLFRRETGQPIHGYRNRLRLRAALARIAAGARDLTRLALDLGFSDHSHLTRAFRDEYGAPPSQWQKLEGR